jgi:hypothetical protein
MGTAAGVGPRGAMANGFGSDFGVDRITPVPMDKIGQNYPRSAPPESNLISRYRRRQR